MLDDDRLTLTNPPTRAAAEAELIALFDTQQSLSTLVGVDFSLGYPAGTAGALGLDGPAWSAMWSLLADRIEDDSRNSNNRFAVAAALNERLTGSAAPFWGCPPSARSAFLASTKPTAESRCAPWREVEEQLRAVGRRPFSSWQLMGAGAVGSQSMMGIPVIGRLRDRYADRLDVWPFTTGLGPPRAAAGAIVVAEVWPSMLPVKSGGGAVRDSVQVAMTAQWLAGCDDADCLASLFTPLVAPGRSAAVTDEEGWVLGVTGSVPVGDGHLPLRPCALE